jgi:hypothetical protein
MCHILYDVAMSNSADGLVNEFFPPLHPELGSQNLGDDIRRTIQETDQAIQEADALLNVAVTTNQPLLIRLLTLDF